jgi:hypothetical protein
MRPEVWTEEATGPIEGSIACARSWSSWTEGDSSDGNEPRTVIDYE